MFFFILAHSGFSQMSGDYNYSIAIKAYNLMQMPQILNQKYEERFSHVSFNGGMFKFNDNQFSYRLSGSYLTKDKVRLVNNCENCEEANGKMTDYSFKIGFEKNINFSRIQPYFGFDIGFRYNKFDGTLTSTNELQMVSGKSTSPPRSVEASKAGFVASPVVGLKVNLFPQVTLFAESNLELFYAYEREETVTQDVNNTRTFSKRTKVEYLLNPITAGIQIHLGSNR